jgi:hypothetical protein
VNPVDTKIRGARHQGSASDGTGKPRVLGWDAASVVVDKGSAVSGFAVGDEVYYAGELERPGSNAEYQAVDERLVGRKPKSIGFAEAAALPLTSITAWELLFDRFGVRVALTTVPSMLTRFSVLIFEATPNDLPHQRLGRFPDMLKAGATYGWNRGWISAARIIALSSRNYDEKELGLGRLPRRMITPMQIGKPPLGASTLMRARSLATVPGA